jgi:20S proteasome subunit beta 2
MGGVDETGPHLFTVAAHGSTDKLPYATLGSGSLAAIAVFESSWRENMEVAEAKALVIAAVSAGIFNDLGSGSNVDICIITKDRAELTRGVVKPNERVPKEKRYVFSKGTTAFTSEEVRKLVVEEEIVATGDSMDTQ